MDSHPLELLLAEHPHIDLILFRVTFLSSAQGGRYIPITRAREFARRGGHAGPTAHNGVSFAFWPGEGPAFELMKRGQERLVPDWSTLRLSLFEQNQAEVICNIHKDVDDFDMCARSQCQRVVSEFERQHSQDVLVGFEIEFHLLESSSSLKPLDLPQSLFSMASLRDSTVGNILREAMRTLEKAEIPVWHSGAETGLAQFEIAAAPQPPMLAADNLTRACGLIKDVAGRHGVYATMAAMPFEDATPTGLHTHLSISKPEDAEQHFLAGLLMHLDETTAISRSQMSSYARSNSAWSWVAWSDQMGVAPIRRVAPGHWEMRMPDAMANPYLLVMSLLAIGGHGITSKTQLPTKPITELEPHMGLSMSQERRKELGVEAKLSRTLSDAVEVLRGSEILKQAFGPKLFDAYVSIKQIEANGLMWQKLQNAARHW